MHNLFNLINIIFENNAHLSIATLLQKKWARNDFIIVIVYRNTYLQINFEIISSITIHLVRSYVRRY